MNKYEKLKYICDTIGYDLKENGFGIEIGGIQVFEGGNITKHGKGILQQGGRDEREIIFTQEFMNKYFCHRRYVLKSDLHRNIKADLIENLENPTDYLFNLMGGKQTQ